MTQFMQRRLGPTETIYYLLDQLYCLNFVVFAEIEGTFDLAKLESALQAVQSEKPLLRSHIVLTKGRPSFTALPMEQAPLKVQFEPLKNWRLMVEQQLNIPFEVNMPLARFLWFGGTGKKSVAAMVFHHSIADGKSGARALIEVLQRASGAAMPLHFQAAHPSAQALDLIEQRSFLGSSVQKLKYWLGQGKAVLRLPSQLPGYDMQVRAQRHIKSIPLAIPMALTQALTAACRAHGTTVHGALGAAQLLAINAEFDNPKSRQLALTSLADLRPVLSGHLSEHDLGLYIATITTVHAIANQPDYWQLANNLRAQLQQVLSSGDANLVHTVYRQDSLVPPNRNGARLVHAAISLAPPASMLTNIGKIDSITLDNGAKVRSLAFAVSPPPHNPICVTAASYGGRMFLNLLYDRQKVDDVQAHRIAMALTACIHVAASSDGVSASASPD